MTAPARTLAPCGTPGAHTRHRRRGEPIDEVCRAAKNTYDNARRVGKRARKRSGADVRETAAAVKAAVQHREIRVVRLPGGTFPIGVLAATDTVHTPVPDGSTGTLCMACFGWIDDPRHPYPPRGRRG
jgi:hypothetical protein